MHFCSYPCSFTHDPLEDRTDRTLHQPTGVSTQKHMVPTQTFNGKTRYNICTYEEQQHYNYLRKDCPKNYEDRAYTAT